MIKAQLQDDTGIYKESVEPQYLKISGLVQSNFYRIN